MLNITKELLQIMATEVSFVYVYCDGFFKSVTSYFRNLSLLSDLDLRLLWTSSVLSCICHGFLNTQATTDLKQNLLKWFATSNFNIQLIFCKFCCNVDSYTMLSMFNIEYILDHRV